MELSLKYQKIHDLCFSNKKLLKKKHNCLCLYCFSRYNYDYLNKLGSWSYYKGKYNTAICPFCNIDSVIPYKIKGKRLTKKELIMMKKYYFTGDDNYHEKCK